jgi:two-component system chemotaxis sensor kinase CheA
MSSDADFLKRLLSTFKIEAEEHITAMSSGLIELEKASAAERQMEIIETVFREAHSLKGAARAVNMTKIEATCHSIESIFSALKRKDIALSPELFDILHKAVDTLSKLLLSAATEQTPVEESRIKELIQKLENVLKKQRPVDSDQGSGIKRQTQVISAVESVITEHKPEVGEKESVVKEQPATDHRQPIPSMSETIRISTAKLDSILLQVEELLSAKLSASQRATELREINTALAEWKKELKKFRDQGSVARGQEITDLRSPVIDPFITSLESKLKMLEKSAEHDQQSLGSMVDNLLDNMKKVLMLPFSSLLEIFPKLVRNISHDRGKDVNLVIRGEEIEIDRRILEDMKDPLIHLVRNCIDHGIEKPEERVRRKKPLSGTITIAISRVNSNKVEILISDDGIGINITKVKASAVRLGIFPQVEVDKLDEQEVLSLIFQSGVSTSPLITDISGRGLGLAIVKEKVDKLGGIVSVETHPNVGTTLRIVLPVTLATFQGIITCVDEHLFILPTTNVDRIVRIKKDEIKTIENRDTISLNGRTISLVPLHAVLEFLQKEKKGKDSDFLHVMVLKAAEKRIAFSVDEVLNEQEVLVKSLGKQLSRVRNIAGAAVLGTGKVVPILNVLDLMKSAVRFSATTGAAVAAEEVEAKKKSILVVEDSITSRSLLKNILETAGYNVKTTVDGVDAMTALRTEELDLVVSDVDMPRINGFELTAKIRSNKKLSEIPVVLVTALESREDRERGIDVGANAYIVKSSFDQSNLLEVIRRLI